MEKINNGLKFLMLLGAVMVLVGLIEVQAYRTVDMDLARNWGKAARGNEPHFQTYWVVQETLFLTHYRLGLRL